jgi:hypothetical protein
LWPSRPRTLRAFEPLTACLAAKSLRPSLTGYALPALRPAFTDWPRCSGKALKTTFTLHASWPSYALRSSHLRVRTSWPNAALCSLHAGNGFPSDTLRPSRPLWSGDC